MFDLKNYKLSFMKKVDTFITDIEGFEKEVNSNYVTLE